MSSRAKAKKQADRQIAIFGGIVILAVLAYFTYNFMQSRSTNNMSDIPFVDPNVEIVTTASGLQYQDLVVGDGAVAEAGQNVSVHYTGWLTDENKFDSSKDRNQPFEFPLGKGRVIKGWDEGVAGMAVGGTCLLIIPPELGYGPQGAGGGLIPPNATLIFQVELLEIK